MLSLALLSGLALGAPLQDQPSFTGRIHLSMTPDMTVSAEPLVIRDDASWTAFVGRIPTRKIQKKQPAPPSTDPVLTMKAPDFAKKTVLVAVRDDMYVHPRITDVTGSVVTVELPDPGDTRMAARRADVGTYHAVIVDKIDGDVVWK